MVLYCIVLIALVATVAVGMSDGEWETYTSKFNLKFGSFIEEGARRDLADQAIARSSIWKDTNHHAQFGLTKFSIWSEHEADVRLRNSGSQIAKGMAMYSKGLLPHLRKYDPLRVHTGKAIPDSVDWRNHGAVTPVKDQGTCGSCWSFSTTGNIEGQWFLAGHNLTSFSEQNLVSCDDLLAFGCDGGFSWIAYSWVVSHQNGTIYTEASYPYVSANGTVPSCDLSKAVGGGRISGGKLLSPWDVAAMKHFIAYEGPLSVAVDATSVWTDYTSGVVTSCAGLLPNHQVLVVGYGLLPINATGNLEYWIVKNSWGTDWGESGYIRIETGKNLCLIETLANSADVESS